MKNTIVFNFIYNHSLNKENLLLKDDVSSYHFFFTRGIDLNQTHYQNIDYYIFCDELTITKLPFRISRKKIIALLYESPIYHQKISTSLLKNRFNLVLTHNENLIKSGHPFTQLYFSTNFLSTYPEKKSRLDKYKLISFIGNIEHNQSVSGYAFRYEISKYLITDTKVDCFGKGIKWIDSKSDGLNSYCFSIAMENIQENYYFTEKLIDCFLTETIPIYWGCSKIGEIFDARGIISFSSLENLQFILENLSFDKYQEMLPFVQKNKKICIDSLLDSFDGFLLRCATTICSLLPLQKKQTGIRDTIETSKFMGLLRQYLLDF